MLVKLISPGVDKNGEAVHQINVPIVGKSCCYFDDELCALVMQDQTTKLTKYAYVNNGVFVVSTLAALQLIRCPLPATPLPTSTPLPTGTPTVTGTPTATPVPSTPTASPSPSPSPSPTP